MRLIVESNWNFHSDTDDLILSENRGTFSFVDGTDPWFLSREGSDESCEITVCFKEQYGLLSSFSLVSNSRNVEVYTLSADGHDWEYVFTKRGEAEEVTESPSSFQGSSVEPPGESKVEIIPKLSPCFEIHSTGFILRPLDKFKLRLLSLKPKDQAQIKLFRVLAADGPGNPSDGSTGVHLLHEQLPVSQFPPAGRNTAQMQGFGVQGQGAMMSVLMRVLRGEDAVSQLQSASTLLEEAQSAGQPLSETVEKGSTRENLEESDSSKLTEVCERLERLEALCMRLESSLNVQIGSLTGRVRQLEEASGSLQAEEDEMQL